MSRCPLVLRRALPPVEAHPRVWRHPHPALPRRGGGRSQRVGIEQPIGPTPPARRRAAALRTRRSAGRAPERARGVRPLAYDVLERVDERLWHVGGQLRVEPDRRRARRIVLLTGIELAQAAE